MNISVCFYVFGILLQFFSLIVFATGFVGLFYQDFSHQVFFIIGTAMFAFASIIIISQKQKISNLTTKQGFLITVMTWLGISFAGALPMYFAMPNVSFIDCWFESVSAITTTGSTVFTGLDNLDKSVQFWRMLLQWIGGMGILVLAVAVLPFLGIGGMKLYKNELPGVSKDKLQPRIAQTAKILWSIYLFITLFITSLYYIFGMNFFDALTHSFTTVSTGGFSNYDASFAYFNNTSLEWIAIFGMFICGLNFALHLNFLRTKNFNIFTKNEEFMFFCKIILFALLFIFSVRVLSGDIVSNYIDNIRYILFSVVSLITTTGYGLQDYEQWHEISPMIILILMFIGGCSGSTSGSIKVLRILVASKQGVIELQKLLTPNLIAYTKLDNQTVDLNTVKSIFGFIGLFVLTFCVVSILLSACGLDFKTSISAAAATITNAGPGLGDVGPSHNFGGLSDFAKFILSLSMLLGRLEIFTFLVIFLPSFWKK